MRSKHVTLGLLLVLLLSQTSCRLFPGIALALDIRNAVLSAAEGEKTCAALSVLAAQPDSRALLRLLNLASPGAGFTEEQADDLLELAVTLFGLCEFADCLDERLASLDPPADNAEVESWVVANADAILDELGLCPDPVELTLTGIRQYIQLGNAIDFAVAL